MIRIHFWLKCVIIVQLGASCDMCPMTHLWLPAPSQQRSHQFQYNPQLPVQEITTTMEECDAVTATFTNVDWMNFYEATKWFVECNSSVINCLVAVVLVQREGQAVDAMALPPAGELTEAWHIAQADAQATAAVEKIELAKQGRSDLHKAQLQDAIDLLHIPLDDSDVNVAVNIVHTLVHDLQLLGLGNNVLEGLKKADNHTRDVLVRILRVKIHDRPKDRDGYLSAAEDADVDLDDNETQAMLLLAYFKDPWNKLYGFQSNSKTRTEKRRRTRRPGRNQNKDTRFTRGGAGLMENTRTFTNRVVSSPYGRSRGEPMSVEDVNDVGPHALNPNDDMEVPRGAQSWSP